MIQIGYQYSFVVGIHFGKDNSSFSIAHKQDTSIYTINNWSEYDNQYFPASIIYKNDKSIVCGTLLNKSNMDQTKLYIPSINDYLLDLDQAAKDLEPYGLTIVTVVTDYIKEFHATAIQKLKDIKKYSTVKQNDIQYCVNCRYSVLEELIRKCFINACLINENDQERLQFLPQNHSDDSKEAVAFGLEMNSRTIKKGFLNMVFGRHMVQERQPFDLIVGLDFGTTFSGCSYSRLDNPRVETIASEWPGDNNTSLGKVPTVLVYDPNNTKPRYWGHEANTRAHKDSFFIGKDFKLFLSLSLEKLEKGPIGNLMDIYSNPNNNDIILDNIISDYLRLFHQHVLDAISAKDSSNRLMRLFFKNEANNTKHKAKYVMTVPSFWDTKTRQKLMDASIQAKIIKSIIVISELEAAALFCRFQSQELQSGSNVTFIVCDAGGGTVDVGTFHLGPTRQMTQISGSQSDTCGSFYLDLNFRKLILQFYHDIGVNFNSSVNKFDELMNTFVNHIKLNFIPDTTNDSYYNLDLPGSQIIPEYVKTEKNKKYILINHNRTLRIKNEVMNTQVFNPVIKRVEDLLDKQIKQRKVDMIFLVGGFAQSKYLQQRLKTRYEPNVHLVIPSDGISAISRGAVYYALNPSVLES